MRRLAVFFASFFIVWPLAAEDGLRLVKGLVVERLPTAFRPAQGQWGERVDFVGCGRHLWLAAAGQLWRLDRREPLLAAPLPITAFTCTAAGTLILAVKDRLGPVQGRLFVPAIPLPSSSIRLAAGEGDTIVLYETQPPARVMRFDGEKVQLVATLAEPITAYAHVGASHLIATPSGIYRLRAGEPLGLVFPWPANEQPIISLAIHPRTAEIVVATANEIFLLDEGRMEQLAHGLGGSVLLGEDAIFVADPRRGDVFRLSRRR